MKIDYEKILKRSFEITKKHKWLLVYGLLAGGGASVSSFNNVGNFSTDSGDYKFEEIQQVSSDATKVLSSGTDVFSDWVQSVSTSTWISLALMVIILVLISIIVNLILKNWAKGALIHGIQISLKGEEEINILNTSPKGIKNMKSLILFSIINTVFVLGFISIAAIFVLLSYLILRSYGTIQVLFVVLGSISSVIGFALISILVTLIAVYAERLIVINDLSPLKAWKKGLNFSKNNFLRSILMGGLNIIISTVVGCLSMLAALVILGIPSFILLLPYINNRTLPHPIVLVSLLLFLLVFIIFNYFVKAAIAVFKYSNWNQMFNIINSHSMEKNQDE